jgi:hypothetical protein
VSAAAELKTDITAIREADKVLGRVSTPIASQEKHEAEGHVVDVCVKLSNVLYVLGFKTGDKVLTSLLGIGPNTFYHRANNAELTLARQIIDLAKAHATELLDFGYTPEKLAAAEATVDVFQSLIAKPMETIGVHKQQTANLKQLFASLDSTLYDQLDKLMVLFKDSHPDFYNEYRTARNIIITSARHKKSATEEAKIEA